MLTVLLPANEAPHQFFPEGRGMQEGGALTKAGHMVSRGV
jgi:hypothetical protein